ncbi:small GTP-binding protein domain-containing protein [Psychrobacillus sp. OK028]|uniref:dynamin family protein n=1 Tax=Psychrobacillus sp. OK028 TaxID=1884359 RepID=UPI000880632D|nr:dynamin family protein [Psychrobacillus sp. OK028]SDN03860.1 small GTP-binding protein domain-containing protein [Psychrobacillus sp. OK028]
MQNSKDLQTIKEQNALLAALFQKNNDDERYRKSKLFADKLEKGTFTIAFAGHFSAGKSSMINALVDEQLLPTSPIPTSANIVTVQNTSNNYALVHFVDQPPVRFSGEYDIQLVKKYSKDGSKVSQIEIGHATSKLPKGITIMDTPGVDSTDDAHRISTESALHLADIVFYVMDYNHVQSELNFQFTKQLLHYNKNVYLIVNQVDKHREEELPFEAYKQSVADAFKSWSVEPKAIFYTSLKSKDFIHNDFPQVQQIVTSSIENKEDYYLTLAQATLEKLKDEHVNFLEDEKAACFETFDNQLSEEDWNNKEDIKEQLELAQKQVKLQDVTLWKKSFEELRKNILENASIMTFEVREALKSYAESKQSTFKVGFLGSKKKTEEERQRRLNDVLSQLDKIVSNNITSHMKLLMKRMLKDVSLLTEEKTIQIDEIQFSIPSSLIDNSLHEGASTTGNAILNFANRVTEAVNRYYINETDKWKDESILYIEENPIEDEDQIASKTNELNEKKLAIHALEEIDLRIQTFEKTVSTPSLSLRKDRDELLKEWEQERLHFENSITAYEEQAQTSEQAVENVPRTEEIKHEEVLLFAEAVVSRAKRIGEVLAELPAFEEAAATIKRKALRVENQQFTIALFGAFSAGKSSFSNALMGANVLPVSPNPTTAAINKIHPISEKHLHNTADVVLKSEGQILADVAHAYEQLGITVHTLEEAYEKASSVMKEKVVEEVHKSFVTAFYKGYPTFKAQLGNVLHVSGEEFGQFVADESKSCFVDFIDFYYDCELTRLGVTLVDTPGADSINARHTGVAFDYIRNADAVLFVTYFNHAFSKADREFLIQLGRVKDAFELDKMFFVVNAIDLADSEEEATLVKQYVQDELQRFGIRFPRVYGVSSLQGLKEKLSGLSVHKGMQQFEESFHHFLEKDLKQISITALDEEATRQQSKLLSLIDQTEANLARKDQRLIELRNQEQNIRKRYTNGKSAQIAKDAKQELDTLLYYVLQRVYYRFNEFFKEAYNPSLFANNSASVALDIALKDILKMIRFDIEQEMRVSNFRILQFIQQQILQLEKEEIRVLKDWNTSFTFSPHEVTERDLLDFIGPFDNIVKYEHVKSYFKNTKSFFENNEKEKLRDTLSDLSKVEADEYLVKEKERLGNWIEQYSDIESEALRLKLLHESITQIDAERKLLEQEETLRMWKSVYARL